MGIEIERKFLVRNTDWKTLVAASHSCTQGYIALEGSGSVRVRVLGNKGFLTLKGPRIGLRRTEFEYEIPKAEAEVLLESFCDEAHISKIRHEVNYGGNVWEIDEFTGENAGLTLAEVELDQEDQSVSLPDWIGKEVSEDVRFFNARLARHPITTWLAKPDND